MSVHMASFLLLVVLTPSASNASALHCDALGCGSRGCRFFRRKAVPIIAVENHRLMQWLRP